MSDRTSAKKPFAPISIDLDEIDQAAEELARRKNIPTLTPPEPSPAVSPLPSLGPKDSSARAAEKGAVSAKDNDAPAPHGYVKCRCPDYLLDQLYLAARRQRVTINHVILSALRAQGFEIRDEDLVPDGRRLRGSRALGD